MALERRGIELLGPVERESQVFQYRTNRHYHFLAALTLG